MFTLFPRTFHPNQHFVRSFVREVVNVGSCKNTEIPTVCCEFVSKPRRFQQVRISIVCLIHPSPAPMVSVPFFGGRIRLHRNCHTACQFVARL